MCDPVVASFAIQAGSQVMEHQAKGAAVKASNRAKLRNFEEQNRQYKREVMLNNNEWKNEVQVQDIQQDQVYQAMVSQWTEQDQQLDEIFAKGDQKIEKAVIEMYESDYAGTQTGRTAGRLAGKSAKKLGQFKSDMLHSLMMSKDSAALNKERAHLDADQKSRNLWEEIRFSPIHGSTPMAPELKAKPGIGGLLLGIAGSAMDSFGPGGMASKTKADLGGATEKDIANIDAASAYQSGGQASNFNQGVQTPLNVAGIQDYMDNPNSSLSRSGAAYDSGAIFDVTDQALNIGS